MKRYIALFCFGIVCLSKATAQKVWTLKECIAYGRANSFEASEIKILNASNKEDKKSIHAAYLPQYNFVANGSFTATNNSFVWNPNLGLEINAVVYSGFRKNYELQKADLLITQSEYAIAAAQNNVEMQVLYAYTEALTKRGHYLININFYKKTKQLYDRLKATKTISESDKYFFDALLRQDEQEIESLQQQYFITLLKIMQIMNLDETSGFEIAEIPPFEPSHTVLEKAFPQAVLADPGISSNQLDIDIARKNTAIARTLLFPTLNLVYTPYYELNKSGIQHYAGLRISLPLFNRLAQKAAIQKANIQEAYQEKQLENQKEILCNAVVLILKELENRQALYKTSCITLEKATRLLCNGEKNLLNKNISTEAYLILRNWNKQSTMDSVTLKYQAISQAKLLDFYTGTAL